MFLISFIGLQFSGDFSTLDIFLGIVLITGIIRGFIKGFIRELASLLALMIGIYGAVHFSYFVLNYLQEYLSLEPEVLNIMAFACTFLILFIGVVLLGHLFTKIAHILALGIFNRLLGAVFGLCKSALILSVILMFVSVINAEERWMSKEEAAKSRLYFPLKEFGQKVLPSVMDEIKEHSDQLLNFDFPSE